ncbi:MAG: glycosyltransferase family 4 protein [Clostridia bacterium]
MKDIVILAHYCGTLDGNHNSRFLELATLLSAAHSVEVITTDFMHATKRHITAPAAEYPFKITLLHEKGYPKNVCLQRFASHHEFGKNVEQYLNARKKPDVIYCAIPSLTAPLAAAEYCRENGIRFVIDVQDLWPEAFRMVFHVPVISDLVFAPMVHMVNRIYAAADAICAVSETYAKRALSVNHKCTEGHSVYLGTRLANFDRLRQAEPKLIKKPGERWIGYIGTLGHSYDLTSVLDALVFLRRERGISNVRFIVMGDGPLRAQFENYANALKLTVTFTGMLSYAEMVPFLCACDIAANPITHGAAQSIINKVGDYAAAGLPVVNTQECPEYRDLVTDYDIGIHCKNGDVPALADAIEMLLSDGAMRQRMGQNNRRLAEERFDRATSYQTLLREILED